MNNRIVVMSEMTKKIKKRLIFSLESLEVNRGDFVTIKGASGSGKTTFLNVIGMNDHLSSGRYEFEGVNVENISPKDKLKIKRNKISFVFQDFGLIEEENINFNLEVALRYTKFNKKEKTDLKMKALEQVKLNKNLKTSVSALSGGEKQRVALARVILKPSIMILADEPTGSLDSKNKDIVTEILMQQAANGKAVIVVTHDETLAAKGNKTLIL
ncbi:ATP-binding cassette domain-containing protein [Xylocopilactobacillus apis]|uniref:Bacteriocin ABC transporter ATP-binding protein n=1 Tax=Xylocopilactobacillus apis TaxID=2932183 RepID=A0AAU9D8I4_9LACO|nr:ATP-binding cassette domain-containing protein [Xylocopilactobacillus apis]BDR55980.1 bacteriocin ABC transporter ATP-binding protein [Xylocopilactobacillus apis]